MKIAQAKKPKAEVPVAGMSDVAFLLLIFFMVSTTFIQQSGIELTPPKAKEVDNIEGKNIIVAIDKDGKVFLNGGKTNQISLKTGLVEMLRDREGKGREVHFKCHKDIKRKVFEKVLISINDAKGKIVIVADEGGLSDWEKNRYFKPKAEKKE